MQSFAIRPLALAAAVASLAAATPALAQVTFYENEGFQGRSFTTQAAVPDFRSKGFNDRASSVVVTSNRWEICEDSQFGGRCMVLRPGQYPSLSAMSMNDRISSVRAVGRNDRLDDTRFAPPPEVAADYRRRDKERVYEVPVSSARAVFGAAEQRCWVEREQVPADRGDARVPGAVLGAVIGGILGHQVGGGSGRDLATAGGAVAGAVVGSNIARNRDGSPSATRDVQRCADVQGSARPAYWDVTYTFRGQEHRIQLTTAPGPTITVNSQGEPRA